MKLNEAFLLSLLVPTARSLSRSLSLSFVLFLFIRKSEQLNGAQFGDQAEGDVIEKKKREREEREGEKKKEKKRKATAAHLESLPFSGKNLLNFRETP